MRRKSKEKKNRDEKKVAVDYRMSGWELFRMLFFIAIFLLPVGWSSVLLLSMLYFLSFASLIVLLIYGHESDKNGSKIGRWLYGVLAGSLLFFALSLNENDELYLMGAYGSAIFSPVLAHWLLLRELRNSTKLAEVFGYG